MSDDLNLTSPLTAVTDALIDLRGDGGQVGKDELITTFYIPMPLDDALTNLDDDSGLEQLPPGTYTPTSVHPGAMATWSVVAVSDSEKAPFREKSNCPRDDQITITATIGVMSVSIYNGETIKVSMKIVNTTDATRSTLYYRDCFTHYKVEGHSDSRHATAGIINGHSFRWGDDS